VFNEYLLGRALILHIQELAYFAPSTKRAFMRHRTPLYPNYPVILQLLVTSRAKKVIYAGFVGATYFCAIFCFFHGGALSVVNFAPWLDCSVLIVLCLHFNPPFDQTHNARWSIKC
jgi:hypothetical protein